MKKVILIALMMIISFIFTLMAYAPYESVRISRYIGGNR